MTSPRTKRQPVEALEPEISNQPEAVRKPRSITAWLFPLLVLVSFLLGMVSSYMVWGGKPEDPTAQVPAAAPSPETVSRASDGMDMSALIKQTNPPQGYKLPVSYGTLGPRLLEAGVIDYEAIAALYKKAGRPLTPEQVEVLKNGSSETIVISPQNSYFLLNFLWAVGLANKNTILTEGPMIERSGGRIERFASTGGWTLATKPMTEYYASLDLIPLTDEQQVRVEEAAAAIYRPCCDNSTLFPDCNHGMAMLGLLELMASQDVSVEEMLQAAKYVNAYWFPQQALETAIYLKTSAQVDFEQVDARTITGEALSSGSGFGSLHQTLQSSGLLPEANGDGGGCAN